MDQIEDQTDRQHIVTYLKLADMQKNTEERNKVLRLLPERI